MDGFTLHAVFLLLAAPFAGSFLGVAADRLSRGESIVTPRSACRSCATTLTPVDLVPILSFILTRGRCRHCGAAIPAWLLYVEIIATGLAGFALIVAPGPAEAWLGAVFLWLLMALCASDLLHFRLPDLLTGALFAVALILSLVAGFPQIPDALIGAGAGAGTFLALRIAYRALRRREGLGLGDVKLMAGLGAGLGWQNLPLMVFLAAMAALAAALAGTLTSGKNALDPARALPFGAALAAATVCVWIALRFPV